ncbi:MAG: ABC transporter ATP-binding protein [Deltaproteobacteria bacterium]|nr:ABC transporter ATP-binding protein [Deltaproteobacteria bacterium]
MLSEPVIHIHQLGKCYHIYENPQDRLKQTFFRRRKYYRDFWALRDISFDVYKGEAVGIIGRNGSGKSTLLQLICGILTPSSGEVKVEGRIASLLELGSGFNPEFTGRENVFLNGAIMGFSYPEMESRFDEITEFADIGHFIDQPVKVYSSGMFVRLAFAVQICIEPDILIVDEALSVGDIFFQQKCFSKIREIISKGVSCLFVSHDTTAVMNICNRAVLLNNGEMDHVGPPEEVVSRYFSRIGSRQETDRKNISGAGMPHIRFNDPDLSSSIREHNIIQPHHPRHGDGGLEIVAARITNGRHEDTLEVRMMKDLMFNVLIRANEAICDPSVGIHLFDRLGNLVFAAGTRQLGHRLPDLAPDQEYIVSWKLTFSVQPGEYTFSLGASEPSQEGANYGFIHDRHEMLGPIVVSADPSTAFPFFGMARLPMSINVS